MSWQGPSSHVVVGPYHRGFTQPPPMFSAPVPLLGSLGAPPVISTAGPSYSWPRGYLPINTRPPPYKRARVDASNGPPVNMENPSPNRDNNTSGMTQNSYPLARPTDSAAAHEAMTRLLLNFQARFASVRNSDATSEVSPPGLSPPPLPDGQAASAMNQALLAENEELKAKIAALEKEKTESEETAAKHYEAKLQYEKKKFEKDRQNYGDTVECLTVDLKEKEEENARLAAAIETLEADLAAAEHGTGGNEASSGSDESLRCLQEEVHTAQGELASLKKEKDDLQLERQRLLQSNADMNEEIDRLGEKAKMLENENSDLREKTDSFSKEVDEQRKRGAQLEKSYEKQIKDIKTQMMPRADYNALTKNREEWQKKSEVLRAGRDGARKELTEAKKELEESKNKLKEANAGNDALTKYYKELMRLKSKSLPSLVEKIKSLKTEKEELEGHMKNTLLTFVDDLKSNILGKLSTRLTALGSENVSLREEIELRRKDIELVEEQCLESSKARDDLRGELEKERERVTQISKRLEEKVEALNAMEEAKRVVEAELKKAERILESIKKNREIQKGSQYLMTVKREEESANLKESLEQYKDQLEQYEDQLQQYKDQSDRSSEAADQLKKRVDDEMTRANKAEAELESLQAKLTEQESQLAEQKKRYRHLHAELLKTTGEKNNFNLRALSLDQKVQLQADIEKELRDQIARTRSDLEKVRKELDEIKADRDAKIVQLETLAALKNLYIGAMNVAVSMRNKIDQYAQSRDPVAQEHIRNRLSNFLDEFDKVLAEGHNASLSHTE